MIASHLKGVVAIDFHFGRHHLFWTDVVTESIYRSDLSRENKTHEVLLTGVRTADGLAVDWIADRIYWTDTGLKLIEVASINGKQRMKLVSNDLEEPRAVAVEPFNG